MSKKLKIFLLSALFLIQSNLVLAGVTFDNADDSIRIASSASWQVTGSITQCMWVYVTNTGATDEWADCAIAGGDDGFYFRQNAANPPAITSAYLNLTHTAPTFEITSTSTVATSTWTHVCSKFEKGVEIAQYINGTKDATTKSLSGDSYDLAYDASVGLWLGLNNSSATRQYGGNYSEYAYWNTALTDNEISILASSRSKRLPLQIQPSSLKIYLPLDDGADGTARCKDGTAGYLDLSGNGNHGTGNDGANNTGLTCIAETVLTYP